MQTKPYVISPYTLLLRDKPNLFDKRLRGNSSEKAVKLEQYLNDLYHYFLYKLTAEMQSVERTDDTKLQAIFDELLKTKKLLEEVI